MDRLWCRGAVECRSGALETFGVDTPSEPWITGAPTPFRAGGVWHQGPTGGDGEMRGVTGAIAMVGALALLVAVVSYDPTPARVVVIALCCALAGFFLGRQR